MARTCRLRRLVGGAVWRPGIYELKEETSLEQVVELAGGFQPDYLTDCIVLERLSPIGRELIPVLYEKNYLGTAVRNFDVIKIYPNSSILPKYFCLDTPQNKALSLNQ
ncbi:MAG: SLBB domain-containing protein [bacterium]